MRKDLRKGGHGVAGEPGGAAAGTEVLRYLSEIWQERMGKRTPLAHEFVTEHRERWVRFHSLPESKRYASDQAERRTILERHYTVFGELFGRATPQACEAAVSQTFRNFIKSVA